MCTVVAPATPPAKYQPAAQYSPLSSTGGVIDGVACARDFIAKRMELFRIAVSQPSDAGIVMSE